MHLHNALSAQDLRTLVTRREYCLLCDETLPSPLNRLILYVQFLPKQNNKACVLGQIGEFWPALAAREDTGRTLRFYETHSATIARHLADTLPRRLDDTYRFDPYPSFEDESDNAMSQMILDQFLAESKALSLEKGIPVQDRTNLRISQHDVVLGSIDMRERLEVDLGDLRGITRSMRLPAEELIPLLERDIHLAATILEVAADHLIQTYHGHLADELAEREVALRLDFRH